MIHNFKNKMTEEVSNGKRPRGFPADLLPVARRKLAMIEAAHELKDLKAPPGNKLHPLKGDRGATRDPDQQSISRMFRVAR